MIGKPCSSQMLRLGLSVVCLVASLCFDSETEAKRSSQAPGEKRTIQDLLSYPFDSGAPMGNAKNPAVILPLATAALVGDLPAARRVGDALLIPVAELQQAADQPFAKTLLAPILSQLTNVKSFDGFSAVDTTAIDQGLPSILHYADAVSRGVSGENPEQHGKAVARRRSGFRLPCI